MDQFTVIRYTFDIGPSGELLESVAEIEDTAVKRTPINWYKMEKFLDNAAELAKVLQTEEYSDVMKKIRVDVEMAIRDLWDQEQEVQEDERLELLQILFERERLKDRERLVRTEKERKIRECRHSAGLKVISALDGTKAISFEKLIYQILTHSQSFSNNLQINNLTQPATWKHDERTELIN
ncbi:unnamed protein product [Fusarium graminearum]|nr:unnamed protein product [Fusarium graminearum]